MNGWEWGAGRGEKRRSERKKPDVEDVVKGCLGYWRRNSNCHGYFGRCI